MPKSPGRDVNLAPVLAGGNHATTQASLRRQPESAAPSRPVSKKSDAVDLSEESVAGEEDPGAALDQAPSDPPPALRPEAGQRRD
ncbi:MAG TPA: hypothetical protein VE029_04475 [Rhizobacter sp.]|nr:hypothetical protein [Rhizobacter sp.]